MKAIIVGGDTIAYFLARTFVDKGYRVTIIDRDPEECRILSRSLKATVVLGEGSLPKILEEAGAAAAHVLIAVTPHDQDNLMACQVAARRFGVPKTLSLVNDPENVEIFRRLGVSAAISTTDVMTMLVEQHADFEEIKNLLPVAEGRINITEIALSNDSPIVGQALHEIDLPEGALVAGILRGAEVLVPRGSSSFQRGDRLIVISLPEKQSEVLALLLGDEKRG